MVNIDYVKEIKRLKEEKKAVILAHYYTVPEVQEAADFIGDSLALSEMAARTDADIIVFAGVHFMAETAKVLSPGKKVLIPDPDAGCSLAESCPAAEFARFKAKYPGHTVVSYVNTTVEVKALTDICCTSSNAVKVIESIPADTPVIFAPDRNLGGYLKSLTGRENMVIWDGACHVHEEFSLERILELKKEYPRAKVLAHPECKAPILLMADFIGSTAALLKFTEEDPGDTYIVVTESGILHQMKKANPGKNFIPAPPLDSTCGCNDCVYMKMVTLEKIYKCLRDESPEVIVDEQVRKKAEGSILNMLEIGA
ncbi:MAG: quinolinate synthase NadA [Rikenellaceae bacterium]|nr:quinolinate synthase NadA [Rikenellaceae bacterium]